MLAIRFTKVIISNWERERRPNKKQWKIERVLRKKEQQVGKCIEWPKKNKGRKWGLNDNSFEGNDNSY